MASNLADPSRSRGRALIIGVNGQDGSYMAEHLLGDGWDVVGIARQAQARHVHSSPRFRYFHLDLNTDREALAGLLRETKPDRIHHVAAVHGAAGFVYEDHWQAALDVNVGSVHTCLEFIRNESPETRLLYASSLKVFGAKPPPIIHEGLPRFSTCLYSITKNAAEELIDYYRTHHGVRATVLYLLNHESPRRPAHFFLPRVTGLLANALAKTRGKPLSADKTPDLSPLYGLDFTCDWGSSAEYMALGAALLEADENQDYVMATGRSWTGLEFTSALFDLAGLDWREHVEVMSEPDGSLEPSYRADIGRMVEVLGAGPKQSALDVAKWILAETYGLPL
ncbi:GDP-mannose 4,6-dehydratase [Methyloligella solikamskensis]|uniref:GDP-mannose 4,6-dehydratase n=1 Tax=Methyloligella solikamskensis TaxID=1177756 RepID=A0ABW3JBG5_9HYPH